MAKPDRWPQAGLFLTASLVGIVLVIPANYQSALINIPHAVFERFENASFHEHYGKYLDTHNAKTLWGVTACISGLGSLITAFFIPCLCAKFGRRKTVIYFAGSAIFLGGILEFLAYRFNAFELFILGQFIAAGPGWILSVVVGISYVCDCSPPKFRGMAATIVELGIPIGALISYSLNMPMVLGSEHLWQWSALLPTLVSTFAMSLLWLCPESPKHFYMFENNVDASEKSLSYYYGKGYDKFSEFTQFDEELHLTTVKQVGLRELFTSAHLKLPLTLSLAAQLFIVFSGATVISQFSTMIFESMHVSSSEADLLTVLTAVPGGALTIIAAIIVDRVGRRPLLVHLGLVSLLLLGVFNILFALQEYSLIKGQWVSYVAVGTLFLNLWLNSIGPLTVGQFVFAEVLPQTALGVGTMVTCIFGQVGYVLLTLLFPPLHDLIGHWSITLLCVVPSVACWFWLHRHFKETKNMHVNEIVNNLAGDKHVPLGKRSSVLGEDAGFPDIF